MKMQLAEIAHAVGAINDFEQWGSVSVTSVAFDSRHLQPGGLFIPLTGEHDGHQFIQSAIDHGAVATLWARDLASAPADFPVIQVDDSLKALQTLAQYYLSKINPRVVAVTGSNGKTTTKDMIAAVLSTQFNVTKTHANFNNEIGVPMTVLSMEPNTEMLVVEMGMDRPGQLDFLSQLVSPDLALITMIGEAHIEFFGTRDKIADAKMEITHGLSDDGVFVFNGDEPLLRERATELTQRQVTFGQQGTDDLFATDVTGTPTTTSFTTNQWPEVTFTIPMIGTYNVNNALAALSVAMLYRIRPESAKQALATVSLTENRAEWVTSASGAAILSDVYNSNPTAAKEVLTAFSQTPVTGQRYVVLGDMLELGDQADAMHASLASAIDATKIDHVYLVGPHMLALQAALAQQQPQLAVSHYETTDLATLTVDLQNQLTADDQILLKGSHGIHLEQVLASLQDSSEN
ncbi:UDP-N-acetylmuramoyl-tripeptide--D-alanyl-D-alanine ligase [Levilactobacillus brevis]|jgi:UDP-N-acetylmuramoyl-tripeptide--D-alanyl-D-alanine ligase|uniref:UDP-N-acetylmuramoyl-tripeptide--D-alanyl-D-alanine ligase n=3 Tax=Levilactobacillus brevis TaxID=1580 RepID=Q03T11_LEVBA|nr:UDP-N-acetylmuramoyl-tripeptide--D-alanyl-D-alanine ligase [Levilactobacillus brevis]ABJ63661.1 UDP-N-acetylmuramoyl-tripeptide--D-alanyl-D-alanine ligase [Levilactobacillus brevis ATCC 367]ARQ93407.1 UDP-N-acetylmuramoyl-tripeptide--D-alanyl-D-alanine ligase [Levilactobacillus brevis]ARW21428.1 UDP-N-acetylmuramoyl-tripeptide--D-alanyl-D-alanine ligase [Levilactobacillus brevis]ARW50007.1 UDP-N-acetylmuramoyl-tripeptide--D-alanyl-D-alanine ligase [Levilactobacillus brevis]KWT47217.1 UDP-N-